MQRNGFLEHQKYVKELKWTFCLLALCTTSAFTAASVSLKDCVERARASSLDMESARLSERSSEASLKTAKTSRNPTVSASINQTLYDSPLNDASQDHYRLSLGLTGSYTLWNGGSTGLNIESKQLSLQASKYNTELAALNVEESAMNAFVALLAAMEDKVTADSALVLSDSLVAYNSRLFDAGTITKSEFSLSKSDAARAKVSAISAAQAERSKRTTLRQILEMPRTDSLELNAPEANYASPTDMGEIPSFEVVLSETRKHYPVLASDSLSILASQKDLSVAHKNSSISVTLGAQATTGFQAWESDSYADQMKDGYTHSLTLGVNIPIIDGGTTEAKVLSAQVEAERAQVTKRETDKTLENNMEQLYLQAEAADASWLAAIAGVEAAADAFAVATEQRNAGSITYTDYLEQKNNLQSAKSVLTQAKYTSILTRSLLDLYMGRYR
ncbi:MAG: TolC family protein [Fibrobacteraceae bacterium]|nr:TolC family protein [Fibrobacteraceae bacterium]